MRPSTSSPLRSICIVHHLRTTAPAVRRSRNRCGLVLPHAPRQRRNRPAAGRERIERSSLGRARTPVRSRYYRGVDSAWSDDERRELADLDQLLRSLAMSPKLPPEQLARLLSRHRRLLQERHDLERCWSTCAGVAGGEGWRSTGSIPAATRAPVGRSADQPGRLVRPVRLVRRWPDAGPAGRDGPGLPLTVPLATPRRSPSTGPGHDRGGEPVGRARSELVVQ